MSFPGPCLLSDGVQQASAALMCLGHWNSSVTQGHRGDGIWVPILSCYGWGCTRIPIVVKLFCLPAPYAQRADTHSRVRGDPWGQKGLGQWLTRLAKEIKVQGSLCRLRGRGQLPPFDFPAVQVTRAGLLGWQGSPPRCSQAPGQRGGQPDAWPHYTAVPWLADGHGAPGSGCVSQRRLEGERRLEGRSRVLGAGPP